MKIGLDFDNTIACYSKAIEILADNIPNLPQGLKRDKLSLRQYLRLTDRESEWTSFQGLLYGPGMEHAEPFVNSVRVIESLVESGHEIVIISHRSRYPYAGPAYNLHGAARKWIQDQMNGDIFTFDGSEQSVFFFETKAEKVEAIYNQACDVFVDDLPEVLGDRNFPAFTTKVHFRPGDKSTEEAGEIIGIGDWCDLAGVIRDLG